MKKVIYLLFSTFFVGLSPLCYGQDFTYKDTRDKSASKYQRIGHIEKYLLTIDGKIEALQEKMVKERESADKSIDERVDKLQSELSGLKIIVSSIKKEDKEKKKIVDLKKFEELEEKVEEQDKMIKELKKEMASLELVLKSLKLTP